MLDIRQNVYGVYVKYSYQWNGSIQTFLSDEYWPSYEPRMLSMLRMHFQIPELYINFSSFSYFSFSRPFFTQQNNHLIMWALNETIQKHRTMDSCSNQIHRWNAEGSEGWYDCIEFYLYPLFLGYVGCSVGNCASKQQQRKNIASGSSG